MLALSQGCCLLVCQPQHSLASLFRVEEGANCTPPALRSPLPVFHSHAALCSQLQVGNRAFAARFKLECPNSWALVNEQDPVPRVPGNGQLGLALGLWLGFVVGAFVCLQPRYSRQQQRGALLNIDPAPCLPPCAAPAQCASATPAGLCALDGAATSLCAPPSSSAPSLHGGCCLWVRPSHALS